MLLLSLFGTILTDVFGGFSVEKAFKDVLMSERHLHVAHVLMEGFDTTFEEIISAPKKLVRKTKYFIKNSHKI